MLCSTNTDKYLNLLVLFSPYVSALAKFWTIKTKLATFKVIDRVFGSVWMSFGGTKDRLVFLREIGLDELGMGDEFGKRGHIQNSSKVFILGVCFLLFAICLLFYRFPSFALVLVQSHRHPCHNFLKIAAIRSS